MAKVHYIQTAFTAGVIDPRAHSRVDLRQFYQGMKVGRNVVTVPLGGVKRRPGAAYVDRLAYVLTARHTAATATASNGGTAANGKDDDIETAVLSTTNISTTNPYVLLHYDLGSSLTVHFVDVIGLYLTAGSSTQFVLQSSTDNVTFTTRKTLSPVTTDKTTWRYRSAAGITARYWRVARVGGTDLGTARVSIDDLLVWSESSTVSAVRLLPFVFNSDQRYLLALTDRSIAVYDCDTETAVDWMPSPYASAVLAEVDYAQSADTMILVQEDEQPRAVVRDTGASAWFISAKEFDNIPVVDFNDSSSPTLTTDVHTVTFTSFAEGDTFQLELEGARTGPISYQGASDAAHQDATAENIRRAVQKLYTVGLTGVSVVYTSGTTWTITLGEDSADDYDVITGQPVVAGNAAAAIAGAKTQEGVARTEPAWSATRGWPRTVTFHEGRLWFGGSLSLPNSYFASIVNDFYNFDTGEGLDDDGIFGTMNTAQLNAINALCSGRDLQLFTSGGEFRFITSPITPATAAPRNQTQYGAAPIKPVSTDGATVFVQKTKKVLRDFLFRYEEDAYSSVPLSVLASHLINNVVAMASWQGDGEDDANLVMVVNGDGTMAVYNTLRSQEIAAWTEWTTDGTFKDVAVVEQERYCAVVRTINGVDYLTLERFDEDYRLDCAVIATPVADAVSGLSHLDGESCRARAGNIVLDDVTPSGGAVSLTADGSSYSPSVDVEIGLNWVPTVTTMPLNVDIGAGDAVMRKNRVVKVRIKVYETLGITLNGRIVPDDYWDLDNYDEAPTAYTGVHSMAETTNYDEGEKTQTISQADPLPFHIIGLDIQMEASS